MTDLGFNSTMSHIKKVVSLEEGVLSVSHISEAFLPTILGLRRIFKDSPVNISRPFLSKPLGQKRKAVLSEADRPPYT